MEALPRIEPNRRVLGDLAVNTTLVASSPRRRSEKSRQWSIEQSKDRTHPVETINTARKRSISEVLGEAALEEEGRQCPSRHTRHVNLVRQAPERPSVELLSDTSGSDASVQTVRVYPGSVDWMRDPHRNPATLAQTLVLRLQLARYRVETDQETVPFDDLRILPRTHVLGRRRPNSKSLATDDDDDTPRRHRSQRCPREAMSQQTAHVPSSPPIVIRWRTADERYDDRSGGAAENAGESTTEVECHEASSRTNTANFGHIDDDEESEEERQIRMLPPSRPSPASVRQMQRRSPVNYRHNNGPEMNYTEAGERERRLTSSVMRGRAAATGLLHLSGRYL
ncbi:MAG: hypothetical protein M1815_002086 [Lichina confinis]|nr:MAG: hypothetical protein M1815_002086 [Lichina confinis]